MDGEVVGKGIIQIDVDMERVNQQLQQVEQRFQQTMQKVGGGSGAGLSGSPGTASAGAFAAVAGGAFLGSALGRGTVRGAGAGTALTGSGAGTALPGGLGPVVRASWEKARGIERDRITAVMEQSGIITGSITGKPMYVKTSGSSLTSGHYLYSGIPGVAEAFQAMGRGAMAAGAMAARGGRAVANGAWQAGKYIAAIGVPAMATLNAMNRHAALGASINSMSSYGDQAEVANMQVENLRGSMFGLTGAATDAWDWVTGGESESVSIARRRSANHAQSATLDLGLSVRTMNAQAANIGKRGLDFTLSEIESRRMLDNEAFSHRFQGGQFRMAQEANDKLAAAKATEATYLFNLRENSLIQGARTQRQQNTLYRQGAFQEARELGINESFRQRIEQANLAGQTGYARELESLRASEIERSRLITPRDIGVIDALRTSFTGAETPPGVAAGQNNNNPQLAMIIELLRNQRDVGVRVEFSPNAQFVPFAQ